jgi:hypothetical protein
MFEKLKARIQNWWKRQVEKNLENQKRLMRMRKYGRADDGSAESKASDLEDSQGDGLMTLSESDILFPEDPDEDEEDEE